MWVGRAVGRRVRLVHVHPRVYGRLMRVASRFFVEPTVMTYELYGCLVNNGVVPREGQGERRLADWLARHGENLGRRYADQDNRPYS